MNAVLTHKFCKNLDLTQNPLAIWCVEIFTNYYVYSFQKIYPYFILISSSPIILTLKVMCSYCCIAQNFDGGKV